MVLISRASRVVRKLVLLAGVMVVTWYLFLDKSLSLTSVTRAANSVTSDYSVAGLVNSENSDEPQLDMAANTDITGSKATAHLKDSIIETNGAVRSSQEATIKLNPSATKVAVSEPVEEALFKDSEWRMDLHLLPLDVRHKLYDSGGDLDHLKLVQSMQTGQPINILMWNDMGDLEESPSFENCPVKNCILHRNKTKYNSSDAILFFMPTIRDPGTYEFPKPRLPTQKWIYMGLENPTHYISNFPHPPDLTATYRHSSDIVIPYAAVVPRTEDPGSLEGVNFAANKTELVVWPVTQCQTPSKRMKYVKKLQNYIPVAIYGHCGTYKCDMDEDACYRSFNKTYKFYLAFESALCDDFITDVVFKALEYNMIPVVMGGADYAKFLPPKSYIDIKKFSSPEALSTYLYHLHNNDAEYNRYFLWKRYYQIQYTRSSGSRMYLCALCHGLHRLNNARSLNDNARTVNRNANSVNVKSSSLNGNASSVTGNASSVNGNASSVTGNASSVNGNASSVTGNASSVGSNARSVLGDFLQWWSGSCHSPADYYWDHVPKWYK